MNPFDFLNAINLTKKDLIEEDPLNEKEYVPFIVNRGLSYFADTVLYANEMNRLNGIDKKWQFQFLLNSIPKKKRFGQKWAKATIDDSLRMVMEYFNYSSEKAKESLKLLTKEQLIIIEEKLQKGGKRS
jgi:hypothetical protein